MALSVKQDADDSDTDYGSDFSLEGEQIVQRLLSAEVDIEDNPIGHSIVEHGALPTLRVPRIFGREYRSSLLETVRTADRVAEQICIAVYPDLRDKIPDEVTPKSELPVEPSVSALADTRSPLERFRSPPKKTLSVTDLVSPAWCQLQYWYTLTLHGRKKRTLAMKQGSKIHQTLEDAVHTTVKVDVQTKEDAWGLRIWNIIQGLRTLRATGITRELEVWGILDGLVVNGVIDELSYVCPDPALEGSAKKTTSKPEVAEGQQVISDFFRSPTDSRSGSAKSSKRQYQPDKVYICDVKTRGAKTLPAANAFLPTKMQLQIYHKLLGALATNMVDFSALTTRYDLDSTKMFSDEFIAQVGSLNDEDVFYDASSIPNGSQESVSEWSQDSMTTLLAHNSLSALWALMISEFQITLPKGLDSLGKTLRAEYRSRDTGEVIGNKTFAMDDIGLKIYLHREMEWWKGQREPKGVPVEEAFKCRSCDFAETCEWRLKKVEEATEKFRMTRKRTSAV